MRGKDNIFFKYNYMPQAGRPLGLPSPVAARPPHTLCRHKLLTAIDDYIFLFRMTFGIYSVDSLEGFFTVAVLLVVFIYFSPAAS